MSISITVNTDVKEYDYEVLQTKFALREVFIDEVAQAIKAALILHSDWTSMVVTFANQHQNKDQGS